MALRVRIRTIFRMILFFIAYKIIANYNEKEWAWLNSTYNQDDNYEIRVYSVYLKDQEKSPENVAGFVTFEDFAVGPQNEMYHTQHLRNLIKTISQKYKKIVMNPTGSKILKDKTSLSSLFIRTLVYENHIRFYEGQPKIKIYYYVS